jgi:hypothetical protein
MAAVRSVAASCGYVLTDSGRALMRDHDVCRCTPKIDGGLIACPDCHTVFGLLRAAVVEQRYQPAKQARS